MAFSNPAERLIRNTGVGDVTAKPCELPRDVAIRYLLDLQDGIFDYAQGCAPRRREGRVIQFGAAGV
jgi:hypothetical protein